MSTTETYIELTIAELSNEMQEIISAFLAQLNFDSFKFLENKFSAYCIKKDYNEAETVKILTQFNLQEKFKTTEIKPQNWNALWESNFQPIVISDKIYVKAPFHPPNPNAAHTIVIDPKMSFGTGHHATTEMMLKTMLALNFEGKTVFDFGCGTGILAIFANMLNAKEITAIDNEEWAFKNAKENFETNNVHHVKLFQGEIAMAQNATYDIILANINKNVIVDTFHKLNDLLNTFGILLLSGILHSDFDDMINVASKYNLKLKFKEKKDQWLLLGFEKDEV